jgi:hypothetical protein
MRYARFHMGDGTGEDGARILSLQSIRLMQTPTISAGDDVSIGLAWFLRDIGGVRIVQHGGSTNGQESVLLLAPERKFALSILTNANAGARLVQETVRWVLREYLGVSEPVPVYEERSPGQLAEYVGRYAGPASALDLALDGGRLMLSIIVTGEFPVDELPPIPPPAPLAFYGPDRVMVPDGPSKGARGEFLRGADGRIAWLRMGGRLLRRTR